MTIVVGVAPEHADPIDDVSGFVGHKTEKAIRPEPAVRKPRHSECHKLCPAAGNG